MSVKGNSEELAECAMYGEYPRVEQLLQEGYSANSLMEPVRSQCPHCVSLSDVPC